MSSAGDRSVVAGVAWTVAARWLDRVIGAISIILLARLLTPTDFGIVAMAGIVVAFADTFIAFGFDWALVRHPAPTLVHYNTAFTLRALSGLGAAAFVVLASPAASAFFNEPAILPVSLFLAFCLFLGTLENPRLAEFRRRMDFQPEFRLRLSSKLAGLAVSVGIAASTGSYWALPLGILASRLCGVGVSYGLLPFRPAPTLAARAELLNFSVWVLLGGLLDFCRQRATDFFISRQLGPPALGVFVLARELSMLGVSEVVQPLNRVIFSKYSRESDDRASLKISYLASFAVAWLVALPAAVGFALIAPTAVPAVLGDQWHGAAPVAQILAIGTVFYVLAASAHYVFLALNMGRISAALTAISVLIMVLLLYFLTPRHGLLGAALAEAISFGITAPIFLVRLSREIGVEARDYFAAMWRPIVATAIMGLAIGWCCPGGDFALVSHPIADIALAVLLGAAVYALGVALTWLLLGRPVGAESRLLAMLKRTE